MTLEEAKRVAVDRFEASGIEQVVIVGTFWGTRRDGRTYSVVSDFYYIEHADDDDRDLMAVWGTDTDLFGEEDE